MDQRREKKSGPPLALVDILAEGVSRHLTDAVEQADFRRVHRGESSIATEDWQVSPYALASGGKLGVANPDDSLFRCESERLQYFGVSPCA